MNSCLKLKKQLYMHN